MNRNVAALAIGLLTLAVVWCVGLYLACVATVAKKPVATTSHPVTSEVVLW